MKKKCMLIALLFVTVQMTTLFIPLPVSAELPTNSIRQQNKNYVFYRTDSAITLDGCGEEEAWANVPWSDASILAYLSIGIATLDDRDTYIANGGFASARFKGVWRVVDGVNTLYFLIEVSDHQAVASSNNTPDGVKMIFNNGGADFTTGFIAVADVADGAPAHTDAFRYAITDQRTEEGGGTYTYEISCKIGNSDRFQFDFWIQDSVNAWNRARYTWNGAFDNETPQGQGILSAIQTGDLVPVRTAAGASIRLDTITQAKSGIRFATSVDPVLFSSLLANPAISEVITGTLILPAETLNEVSDNLDFVCNPIAIPYTEADLMAAGLEAGKDYYNIVNQGNQWVDGQDGTWYGTLYNIKDFGRQFSGVGYIQVIYQNGDSYTLYGEYADSNARSVSEVAEIALQTGVYTEEDNPVEWALLQNFITGGSPR